MSFLTIFFIIALIVVVYALLIAIFFQDAIKSTKDKDPAAKNYFEIIMLYPGLHALIIYRITHYLWKMKIPFFPRALSQFARLMTGIEIHPGAEIGKGLFIDHGMGVVIGETTVIEDNVTLFQGVTLGGTGKETGKRHPTIKENTVVGAGAKILGNITVGANTYVGANAVIIRNVPSNSTVVGVPGHVTKQEGKKIDLLMDHAHVSDPIMQHLKDMIERIKKLENKNKS